jgi:hypothetical protein
VRNKSVGKLILGRGRENPGRKLSPALKINNFWTMAYSIPYLVPSQFQESIFPPITRPKIPVLDCTKVHQRKPKRRIENVVFAVVGKNQSLMCKAMIFPYENQKINALPVK